MATTPGVNFTGARMASVDAGDVSPDHLHDIRRRDDRGAAFFAAAAARHRGHQDPRPAPLERLDHAPQRASGLRRRQPRRDGHGPAGQGHLAPPGAGRATARLQRRRRALQRPHPPRSSPGSPAARRAPPPSMARGEKKAQIKAAAMGARRRRRETERQEHGRSCSLTREVGRLGSMAPSSA